jgi:hypothetical protein
LRLKHESYALSALLGAKPRAGFEMF